MTHFYYIQAHENLSHMNQTMELKNLRCQYCLFHLKNLQSSYSLKFRFSKVQKWYQVQKVILSYQIEITVQTHWNLGVPLSSPPPLGAPAVTET